MGIQVEFNPDLALRKYATSNRTPEECLPEKLLKGTYKFLKKGQRNYWLQGELPLLETDGEHLSMPLASIVIIEATHCLRNNEPYTEGLYQILEVYDKKDKSVHFNGFAKLHQRMIRQRNQGVLG